jgi:hypothetical protein
MKIESARALKQEIASDVVPPAVAAISAAGGFSLTTFALHKMTRAEPLVALGVAQGKRRGDVRLAVRLQRHSLERSTALLQDIRKRAKNEVDIRFVGRIAKHALPWYRQRQRPLQPGSSAGHFKITAGTIGAIARERRTGRDVILSNNHVLANENDAKKGDAILQPGVFDMGKLPRDLVAKLTRWIDLKPNGANLCDAAIATIVKDIDADPLIYRGIGRLAGVRVAPMTLGMTVSKVGRTTGVTQGRISAIELDKVVIPYDLGMLSFDDQVEIESTGKRPFSARGDSGSLILDEENRGCALLFAGSETGGQNGGGLTYANPIAIVLKRLAIDLHDA